MAEGLQTLETHQVKSLGRVAMFCGKLEMACPIEGGHCHSALSNEKG